MATEKVKMPKRDKPKAPPKRVPDLLKAKESAPRRFATPEDLEKAIDHYLKSITILKPVYITKQKSPDFTYEEVMAMSDTEKLELYPAKDGNGKPIMEYEWISPPLEGNVQRGIGIDSREVWFQYKNDPEFADIIHKVEQIAEDYIRNELVARNGNTTGLQFALRCGYGWRDVQYQKTEIVSKLEDEFDDLDD